MATNPKYPVEARPRPQLVTSHAAQPPRSFRWIVAGITALIVAVVILVAVWLLKYGGGRPEEQPKPHHTDNGLPSTQSLPALPRLQPRRPPLYAWTK